MVIVSSESLCKVQWTRVLALVIGLAGVAGTWGFGVWASGLGPFRVSGPTPPIHLPTPTPYKQDP